MLHAVAERRFVSPEQLTLNIAAHGCHSGPLSVAVAPVNPQSARRPIYEVHLKLYRVVPCIYSH
eukprot:scaffold539_cov359-Prasinococcus_capsulatus_cf.AAC.15